MAEKSFPDIHCKVEPGLKDGKFYLLGHTQGLLPTDNFEFLADYKSVDETTGLDPLIQMALMHYQFEAIHPLLTETDEPVVF